MGMVDYAYYRDVFGGNQLNEDTFTGAMEEAKTILASLLYPCNTDALTPSQDRAYRIALCYEAEYLSAGASGARLSNGTMQGIKSEKIGDYAVEYGSQAANGTVSINGQSVSPAAVSCLTVAGLMTRWV